MQPFGGLQRPFLTCIATEVHAMEPSSTPSAALAARIEEILSCVTHAVATGTDPAVALNAPRIYDALAREESLFLETLSKGQKVLDDLLSKAAAASSKVSDGARPTLAGADAFLLYDTFGFPLELTAELAEAAGVAVSWLLCLSVVVVLFCVLVCVCVCVCLRVCLRERGVGGVCLCFLWENDK